MTAKEVLTLIREKEVKAIDLRFADFPGTWQHFTIPPHHLEESTFQDGLGFDGSSIRGWQAINESDMLVIPQAETAFIDPFFKQTPPVPSSTNPTAPGIDVEAQHHEVATAGQCEIDMKFSPLVEMADKVMKYKYIVKNTAKKHGKTVTFMPKPLFQDNGTGMHVHISLWKNNANLFAGSGYAGLSEMGLYAIGGLIRHAPAICA